MHAKFEVNRLNGLGVHWWQTDRPTDPPTHKHTSFEYIYTSGFYPTPPGLCVSWCKVTSHVDIGQFPCPRESTKCQNCTMTSFTCEWRHSRVSDVIQNIENRLRTFLIQPYQVWSYSVEWWALWRHFRLNDVTHILFSIGPCYTLGVTLGMCQFSWKSENLPARESQKRCQNCTMTMTSFLWVWRHSKYRGWTENTPEVSLYHHAKFEVNRLNGLDAKSMTSLPIEWRHSHFFQ